MIWICIDGDNRISLFIHSRTIPGDRNRNQYPSTLLLSLVGARAARQKRQSGIMAEAKEAIETIAQFMLIFYSHASSHSIRP